VRLATRCDVLRWLFSVEARQSMMSNRASDNAWTRFARQLTGRLYRRRIGRIGLLLRLRHVEHCCGAFTPQRIATALVATVYYQRRDPSLMRSCIQYVLNYIHTRSRVSEPCHPVAPHLHEHAVRRALHRSWAMWTGAGDVHEVIARTTYNSISPAVHSFIRSFDVEVRGLCETLAAISIVPPGATAALVGMKPGHR
jgi:hypothetical protein